MGRKKNRKNKKQETKNVECQSGKDQFKNPERNMTQLDRNQPGCANLTDDAKLSKNDSNVQKESEIIEKEDIKDLISLSLNPNATPSEVPDISADQTESSIPSCDAKTSEEGFHPVKKSDRNKNLQNKKFKERDDHQTKQNSGNDADYGHWQGSNKTSKHNKRENKRDSSPNFTGSSSFQHTDKQKGFRESKNQFKRSSNSKWSSDSYRDSDINRTNESGQESNYDVAWDASPGTSFNQTTEKETTFKERKTQKLENWRRSNAAEQKERKSQDETEKQFDFWEKNYKTICKDFVVVEEIQGDLFEQSTEYSLAHCVAEDLRMGSGIAVNFKQQFKNLDFLLNQNVKQGGVATLEDAKNKRYIYYLVTKRESNLKPTYYNLWRSLVNMRDHIISHKINKLAIPRLGCGLDRLEWDRVKVMLEYLFKDVDMKIRVCNFQQNEDLPKKPPNTCKLVRELYNITKINSCTAIFYFTTEDGHQDSTIKALDAKFNFVSDLRRSRKNLGDGIKFETRQDVLFGCVVRKSVKEPFDFQALNKCIINFNKLNRTYGNQAFSYVGLQTVDVRAYHDDLINEKIITLLSNQLRNVELYICSGSLE